MINVKEVSKKELRKRARFQRKQDFKKWVDRHIEIVLIILTLTLGIPPILGLNHLYYATHNTWNIPRPTAPSKLENGLDLKGFEEKHKATQIDTTQYNNIIKQINKELNK